MHLRTFHAASIQDAIRQARQELGADAMLLNSRRVTGDVTGNGVTGNGVTGNGVTGNGVTGNTRKGEGGNTGKPKTSGAEGSLFAVTFATANPAALTAPGTGAAGMKRATSNGNATPASGRKSTGGETTSGEAETSGQHFDSAQTWVGAVERPPTATATGAGKRVLSQLEEPLGYAPPMERAVQASGGEDSNGRVASRATSAEGASGRDALGARGVEQEAAFGAEPRSTGEQASRRGEAARTKYSNDEAAGDRALPSYDKLFEQMTSMRREMLQLAGSVRRAGAEGYRQDLPSEELRWIYDAMIAQEFYLDLIEEVIEELSARYAETAPAPSSRQTQGKSRGRKRNSRKAEPHPSQEILPAMREALGQRIDLAAEPGLRRRSTKPHLIALVGPPGVGKTTTLVKLAARYGATSRFPLQIVSMDNYRVGASEQLRTYASILGVGFDALPSAGALQKALASYQAKEVILIDTPGYGWRDFPAASDLAALLREEAQTSIHLTVSASMKPSDLGRVADLYEVFDYDSLLFTKIDETATIGPMVSESVLRRKPLSYFCAGQRIPDDLEVASRERLLARMLPAASASDEFAA